jgi:hypothetical protein
MGTTLEHRVSLFVESMISAYLYVMLMLTDFHAVDENPLRDT